MPRCPRPKRSSINKRRIPVINRTHSRAQFPPHSSQSSTKPTVVPWRRRSAAALTVSLSLLSVGGGERCPHDPLTVPQNGLLLGHGSHHDRGLDRCSRHFLPDSARTVSVTEITFTGWQTYHHLTGKAGMTQRDRRHDCAVAEVGCLSRSRRGLGEVKKWLPSSSAVLVGQQTFLLSTNAHSERGTTPNTRELDHLSSGNPPVRARQPNS